MAVTRPRLGRLPALLLTAAWAGAADTPATILMDDIDQWRADLFCGNPAVRDFLQGPKLEAGASGITVFDSQGNAYMACETFIQVVTKDGQALLLTGAPEVVGNTDGPPGRTTFGNAIDLALVNDNLLYVVDAANLTLRKVERKADGVWHTETVAGTPGRNGHRDGPGREALFTNPFESITVDENGVVYLLDGDWLRKFENGVVTTLNAGTGYQNGPLKEAKFSRSQGRQHGMTSDGKGNIYIADKANMAIRKVDLNKQEVTTVAGVLPGVAKTQPRDGKALDARFHPGGGPNMAFYNSKYDLLIVRSDDETAIRVIKDGWVKTFGPAPGRHDALVGPWKNVSGGVPCGIDRDGNVYVMGSRCVRVVKKAGAAGARAPQALRQAQGPERSRGAARLNDASSRETKSSASPIAAASFSRETKSSGSAAHAVAPRLTMTDAMPLPRRDLVHERHPALTYGDGKYLIVWQVGYNGVGGSSDILALRLDAEGRPIDKAPIEVCTADGIQDSPAVAFCGGRFLVAWADFRNGSDYDVYAALVGADGRVTPKDGFLLSGGKGGQAAPAVASNGKDQFLAVWQGFDKDHFGVHAARIAATSEVLDKPGVVAMTHGERPVVTWTGKNYAVCQKWYATLVGEDGKVQMESKQLWNSKTVFLPAVASAWGKAFLFVNTEPFQDPWGWGGNGSTIGVSLNPDGESPERGWAAGLRDLQAAEADGKVKNCLDAARWRNHPGWPMGMRGALKGTHDDMWPSGCPAAAFNGRSLLVVWPKAHLVDNRRLANRDLYMTRVLPDWGLADRPAVKLVAGDTEEANPVLSAGDLGRALLAYERVVPDGVTVECRLLTESEDQEPPKVAYVVPMSDTQLIVAFDEPVDAAGASKAANYAIEGLAVKSAEFNADPRGLQREVILTTDPHTRGKTYVLRMTGIQDRTSRANPTAGDPVEFLSKPGAFQRTDFIAEWLIAGPFPRDIAKHPFDPARERPSAGDAVLLKGAETTWAVMKGQALDLGEKFGEKEGMAYANTYVFSDRPREALLRLDTNDHNRAWLNGRLVNDGITTATATRGFHDYSDEIPVTLEKGWNQLLLQVENRGGAWLMIGQITDKRGEPLRDLTWQVGKP